MSVKMVWLLVLLAITLFSCAPCNAALAVVQSANCYTTANGSTPTVSTTNTGCAGGTAMSATTSGNLLVIFVCQGASNSATVTISDSASQTWTQTASGYSSTGGNHRAAIFFIPNSSSVTSVTGTWTSSVGTVDIVLYEVSGAVTSSPEDSSVNNSQTATTTATSGSLTTNNANDILLFGSRINGSHSGVTAGSGYTMSSSAISNRGNMQYQIVSSAQSGVTTTMTWTTTEDNENVFAAFKGTAASGPPPGQFPRILGALLGGLRWLSCVL